MQKRQEVMKILLVVLLGVWGVIFAYQYGSDDPFEIVSPVSTQGKGLHRKPLNQNVKLALKMNLLENSRQVKWSDPKNIFKPVRIYVPPPPPPPPPPVPEVYIPTPEEIAAERARQDLSQYRVLGFLNKGDRQEVFLSKGGELLISHRGDMVQGKYLVKELDGSRVVLHDPLTQVEVTIVVGNP